MLQHKVSLEIQLEDETRKLSKPDQEICRSLMLAIRCVQHSDMFGSLPKSVRTAIEKWSSINQRSENLSVQSIRTQVEIAERVYGLKRTRANRAGETTAFEFAARRLGISANTVANKVGRRRLPRITLKK